MAAGDMEQFTTTSNKQGTAEFLNEIKIGRNASEEVILELIRSKCIPILIYGLECFVLTKSDLKSLDFAVNRFLMKLFRSNNTEIIAECRRYFQFKLPSELIEKKKTKFEENTHNFIRHQRQQQ